MPSTDHRSKKRRRQVGQLQNTTRGEKITLRDDKRCPPQTPTMISLNTESTSRTEMPDVYEPPFVPLKPTKTSNDYLREWIPKRHACLNILLEGEAPPPSGKCVSCQARGEWRCFDCLGSPFLCGRCCCSSHTTSPFHRVKKWTGSLFAPGWLSETGVGINLGHGTALCPSGHRFLSPGPGPLDGPLEELDADPDVISEDDTSDQPTELNGHPVMTVVDVSGIHHLPFRFCRCDPCDTDEVQLLRAGFVAASFIEIKTVFTTRVLDDFLLENLECKVSASSYFEKLRRKTLPQLPHTVKNRYPHLLRLSRIWRNLKSWKRHGFGHSGTIPGEGELAIFCPACPQPGINLLSNWEEEQQKNPLLYMRSFVMDGNFTASHMAQKRPEDDVWLSGGTGMMTERGKYNAHLARAGDAKPPKNECNATRALNAQIVKTGTTATGIGATACARNGFFCPTSVVDFQKGERQANMDYSLYRALKFTRMERILYGCLEYDAVCRYAINLHKRFNESPYLSLPDGLTLFKGIGSFHVHSHVKECYQRYGLSLMPGAGLIDGEILETLWAVLNQISPSTRGATAAHRDEIMDDHMNYSNWKKTTQMSRTLVKKYGRAVSVLSSAEDALALLKKTISQEYIAEWSATAETLQRMRNDDVKVMDWFAPKQVKDPHRAEVQLKLSTEPEASNRTKAASHVLSDGLQIQESQIILQQFIRSFGTRKLTTTQDLEVVQKRAALRKKIDDFHDQILPFLGVRDTHADNLLDSHDVNQVWAPDVGKAADLDDDFEDEPFDLTESLTGPERDKILLPSRIGKSKCQEHGLKDLQQVEIALRCGQANEALHNLRLELGKRAFTFTQTRQAPSKRHKTRSWSDIQTASSLIRKWARVYRQARAALEDLGAGHETMSKYQELLDEHLKLSTSLLDTSIPGQRYKSLPWFWGLGDVSAENGSDVMREFSRVHWVRTQAQVDRAREEKLLVEHEMRWTINYFLHKANTWTEIREKYPKTSPGHKAYAYRQEDTWLRFADEARTAFRGIID